MVKGNFGMEGMNAIIELCKGVTRVCNTGEDVSVRDARKDFTPKWGSLEVVLKCMVATEPAARCSLPCTYSHSVRLLFAHCV